MNANVGSLDGPQRVIGGAVPLLPAAARVIGPWGRIGVAPLLAGVSRFGTAHSRPGVRSCKPVSTESAG